MGQKGKRARHLKASHNLTAIAKAHDSLKKPQKTKVSILPELHQKDKVSISFEVFDSKKCILKNTNPQTHLEPESKALLLGYSACMEVIKYKLLYQGKYLNKLTWNAVDELAARKVHFDRQ